MPDRFDSSFQHCISKFQPEERQFARAEQPNNLDAVRQELGNSSTHRQYQPHTECVTKQGDVFGHLTLTDNGRDVATTQRGFQSNSEKHGNYGANVGHRGAWQSNAEAHGNYGANVGHCGAWQSNAEAHGNYGANVGHRGAWQSNAEAHGNYGTNVGQRGAWQSNAHSRGAWNSNMNGNGQWESNVGHTYYPNTRRSGYESNVQLHGNWTRYSR